MAHSKTPWAKRLKKKRFKSRYLSKMQAQRLLQVDSMTFRRLCILKGIYPRSIAKSRQKDSGNTKQYYLAREVKWLVQDDIRSRLAAFEAWQKKVRRAKAQHRFETLKILQTNQKKPHYRLDATIKERYPTFMEALRDVDDAMSMIALYAALSPEIKSRSTIELHQALPSGLHDKAKTIVEEWMWYVSKSHALSKSFISIKGYYHEAIVHGERIVWLMPHEYSCKMPTGVQQYILITFLEFYVEMMRFIMFKLKRDLQKDLEEQARAEDDEIAANADEFEHAAMVEVGAIPQSNKTVASKQKFVSLWRSLQGKITKLFKGFTFYISREVPKKHCEMIVEMLGGVVVENFSSNVTHFIVDRPELPLGFTKKNNVEYLQPQYLFDCLNGRVVLPVQGYRMGEELPAHVSPFSVALSGDAFDVAELEEVKKDHPKILGYVPQRVHEIRRARDPLYVASDAAGRPLGKDAAVGGPNDDDDNDSIASEEARAALVPDMGDGGDVELDDADLANLPKRAHWEDEQVSELPSRSAVSALKVLKQRELNSMNAPTSDAAAQRRADAVNTRLKKIRDEPESKRVARKEKQLKLDKAAREKMKLQVTRKKAAKYYQMIKGTQNNMQKKEEILARKAEALKKGTASASNNKTFSSAKEARTSAKIQEGKKSADPQKRQKAHMMEQKKKAKVNPYSKLPKWTQ